MPLPPAIDRRIDALQRNDPDEAEAIAFALVYEMGYCPSGTAHYLFMMQDDDAPLRKRLTGLDIRPEPGEGLPS